MLNHISLVGRLVADPEERTLPSGDVHVRLTLAVERPYTTKNGERGADFIDVVSWGHDKETIKTYAKKGEPLAVEGRLRIRSYTTDHGETRKVAEVVLDRFYFLRDLRKDRNDEPHDGGREAPERSRTSRRAPRTSSSSRTARPRSRPSRPLASPAPVTTPAEDDDSVPF